MSLPAVSGRPGPPVSGPAGSGRTQPARELPAAAAARCERVRAAPVTASAAQIPFGAPAHLPRAALPAVDGRRNLPRALAPLRVSGRYWRR